MMRSMKAFPLGVLAGALLCSTALLCNSALLAQNSAVAPRITTDVDELSLTTLRGNVPHMARAEFDQGEADAATQLTHMRLVLSRSTEQQAALDTYLAQLQDKSSPNYHKWLTPQQFGALYGPADSDIAALVAWLESHGFQVELISPGRTNIAFNGTVSQAEEAFHTPIHSFLINAGQTSETQFYSNTAEPQIPSAITSVVKGVARLNTIQPRPHFHRGTTGQFNPDTKRLESLNAASATQSRPNLTTTSGGDTLWMVPADAATIYDTPNAYNANFTSGTSYTGAGVHIGIGGDAAINASIVEDYRIMFIGDSSQPGLNYCTSSSVSSCSNTPGSGYIAGDADEAYLDTELVGGMAPGATIIYYASPDLNTAIEAAIDQNGVDIFSLSFGECEVDNGSSVNALINGWWEQAAGQGIAVTVSTGDSGSAGCDYPSTNSGANVPDATGGLAVSGYASTPYNIAVGGTDFYALETAFSSYVSTSQGSNTTHFRTVLPSGLGQGYIPESVWNDSVQSDTQLLANNVPFTGSNANIVAGSGGVSAIYSKPSWQTGTGVPADGKRDLPDVSLMSGNGADNATWLVCTADTERISSKTYTENCTTQSNGSFYFAGFGGTSTAAPAFAGILAMVQQKAGEGRLGQAATELYSLYNGSHASAIFHDITVGNNSVPCTSGTLNCVNNTAGYYYESGYNTTTGFDLASGMGSVDVTQLMNYWGTTTGSAPATVTFTSVTPNPVVTTGYLSVDVTVTGSSGTPTGTVTLTGAKFNSGAQTLSNGGSYTFDIVGASFPIGTNNTITATYNGSPTYATATANYTTLTVTGLTAAVTAVPSATTINSNQTVSVTGTVTCIGTCTSGQVPTGTVTLSGGGYTSPPTVFDYANGSYSITVPYNSLNSAPSPGLADTLTVTYNGNAAYDAGASAQTSVTVTYVAVLTPTVTVTPASSSINTTQSLNVTVAIAGAGATPTGTITLTSGSYNSGVQTIGANSCSAATCTITIPANSLNAGTDTLTATYSGDAVYASIVGTNTVSVTKAIFSLSATNNTGLAPGATTGNTSTVTVTSGTLYSGTVTLTCALTTYPSGAIYLPTCSGGSSTITLVSGVASGTGQATITVNTTAATAALDIPRLPGRGRGWAGAGGSAVLAFLLFLGIPARRRSWRSMLGILVMIMALGGLAACGGSPSNTSTTSSTPGTTAGTYTFTVTGTGNPTVTPAPTTTFTVTVT